MARKQTLTTAERAKYALVPIALEARWPAEIGSVKEARLLAGRLRGVVQRLGLELAKHGGVLAEAQLTHRRGTLASELTAAVAQLDQARCAIELAADLHLLEQRRSRLAVARRTRAIADLADELTGTDGGQADD